MLNAMKSFVSRHKKSSVCKNKHFFVAFGWTIQLDTWIGIGLKVKLLKDFEMRWFIYYGYTIMLIYIMKNKNSNDK